MVDQTPERTRPAHARTGKGEAAGAPVAATKVPGAIIEKLRRLIASELSFYVRTKGAHWTVRGPLFRELHKLLDMPADISIKAVDLVAERVVQLDATPPLGFGELVKESRIEDRSLTGVEARGLVEGVLADETTLVGLYRDVIAAAEEAKDYATVDLLSKILVDHEEAAWYLRKTLEKDVSFD